ncbi:DUF1905 domain-containing protein [Pedobacter gandavensis]|uniref:DUF1905 domain-containing protein n=1 Tax=Pedobacter gandavensis TaxID=2679963 RepID=UPI00292E502E|nr:DUF1905 domain-containing protein [Pedobacter gandavensis]
MIKLLKNKKLTLNYIPNHGAWTYNIVIPDSRDIKGKWGYIKVSGTIDGYEFKNMNLAPRKGLDMYMSVNAEIRKAIACLFPICTDQQEYFEHLNRFLLLIEPIIEDLEWKKFI